MLSGVMTTQHLPLSDQAQACNGGNGRLDVYLVDSARSLTTPYSGCSNTPVFVLLKRTSSDALAVHEIFHAMQYSFPLAGCITDKSKYRWWAEASAEWAMDFVFPNDPAQTEHKSAPGFLSVPEKSLDLPEEGHEYGAYLLPFYLHRKIGSTDFVRVAWEKCANQPALEAVDQAIAGGFEAVWPEFVRFNWNRNPVEDYTNWDGMKSQATPAGGGQIEVKLGASRDIAAQLNVDLPRLSATYKHFIFTDDSSRTVVFWNGVTSKLSLDARIEELGVQYQSDPASAEEKKGARIQALIKMRGQDWQVADWTDLPYVAFCRDTLAERIDELVVIISNSEFKDRERKLKPPDLAPVLWVSNMGCWRYKGTVSYTDGDGVTISTSVKWTRPDEPMTPPFVNYKAEGTESWSSSGSSCAGSGTLPILPDLSTLFTYNFTPSQGAFHRSYWGSGIDTRQVTTVCAMGTFQLSLSAWLFQPIQSIEPVPFSRILQVNSNGTVMDDTFTIPEDVWRWHFEAEREP
jgi:hypothetical protein